MKLKLNQPILNFNGDPIRQDEQEITYGQIFRNILGAPSEKDTGEKKLQKFNMGIKCVADEVDLSLDERKLLKDLSDEAGVSPLLYGRICQLLEDEGINHKS